MTTSELNFPFMRERLQDMQSSVLSVMSPHVPSPGTQTPERERLLSSLLSALATAASLTHLAETVAPLSEGGSTPASQAHTIGYMQAQRRGDR